MLPVDVSRVQTHPYGFDATEYYTVTNSGRKISEVVASYTALNAGETTCVKGVSNLTGHSLPCDVHAIDICMCVCPWLSVSDNGLLMACCRGILGPSLCRFVALSLCRFVVVPCFLPTG